MSLQPPLCSTAQSLIRREIATRNQGLVPKLPAHMAAGYLQAALELKRARLDHEDACEICMAQEHAEGGDNA